MIEFEVKPFGISIESPEVGDIGTQPSHNVLLLSERRIADLAAFCLSYEFEDTFAAVSDAKRIDAIDLSALRFSRRIYKLARLASGSPGLARQIRAPAAQQSGLGTELRALFSSIQQRP